MTERKLIQVLTNQKGVALLLAMSSLIMMTFIAVEVQYSTQVEALSANQAINRLKAYYAAKAGVELSLYRIMIYRKAGTQFGKLLGDNSQLLDKIWQLPFAWPIPLPKTLGAANKDEFLKANKESIFDGKYVTSIESEESKIDVNDLGSKSKSLSTAAKAKLLNILIQKRKDDEKFRDKYQERDFNEIINNMTDWVDEDSNGEIGGDERSLYSDIKETDKLPPNQAFKSIQELHMVAKMDDQIYNILAPHLTVYGSGTINVNLAGKDVLRSLDPEITEEMATRIIARRNDLTLGGPFKNDDDFYGFLESIGLRVADLKQKNFPLEYKKVVNFRVTSIGSVVNVTRKITAIVYDFEQVKTQLRETLAKDANNGNPTPTTPSGSQPTTPAGGQPAQPTQPTQPGANPAQPQGRPIITYWFEN